MIVRDRDSRNEEVEPKQEVIFQFRINSRWLEKFKEAGAQINYENQIERKKRSQRNKDSSGEKLLDLSDGPLDIKQTVENVKAGGFRMTGFHIRRSHGDHMATLFVVFENDGEEDCQVDLNPYADELYHELVELPFRYAQVYRNPHNFVITPKVIARGEEQTGTIMLETLNDAGIVNAEFKRL